MYTCSPEQVDLSLRPNIYIPSIFGGDDDGVHAKPRAAPAEKMPMPEWSERRLARVIRRGDVKTKQLHLKKGKKALPFDKRNACVRS